MKSPPKAQGLCDALESAGVEFVAENGGGAGVRLRKAGSKAASIPIEDFNAQNDE